MNCVARYGLDGSTLERIAQEAGVRRPLLRHYLGNRDEMVDKLLNHIITKFDGMMDTLVEDLPEDTGRWPALFDRLFAHKQHSSINSAVFQALVAASETRPELKAPLRNFVEDFESLLAKELARAYPEKPIGEITIAAGGIASIYFAIDAMLPLRPSEKWRTDQRKAAAQFFELL